MRPFYRFSATSAGSDGKTIEAVPCQSEKADAYINLGILYQKRKEYRLALIHYETAVRIAPNHPMATQIKTVISEIKTALSWR